MTATETPAPPNEAERTLNIGLEVETATFGTVRVKELCLEQIVDLLSDIAKVFEVLPADAEVGNNAAWLIQLVKDEAFLSALKKVVGASINRPAADLTEMNIKDWLKLVVALKTVMDWEEIKDLFFQIVRSGALGKLTPPAEAP